jgi:ABC-type proline/glycine betaine transport system permease subunit
MTDISDIIFVVSLAVVFSPSLMLPLGKRPPLAVFALLLFVISFALAKTFLGFRVYASIGETPTFILEIISTLLLMWIAVATMMRHLKQPKPAASPQPER